MSRARTRKRELERELKKLGEAKLKLQAFEPGFSAAKPITVDSTSQIEPHVRGMHCPMCDIAYQVVEHVARNGQRVVRARCTQCGRTPEIHFVLFVRS